MAAEGSGLTYQWQTKLTPKHDWADTGLTGSKTDTLSFMALASFDGRQYRCVVKDNTGNSIASEAMTLTVSTLSITKQPEDLTVASGTNTTIKITAEGSGLTYQWQTKLTPNHDWADTGLTGAKTDTLQLNPALASFNGRQYRCIVTDGSGNRLESDSMTLTVFDIMITEQPEDMEVSANTNVSIRVVAKGNHLTYQWQTKLTPNHDWADTGLTGAKTDTLQLNPALISFNGRQYRCIITNGDGVTVTSEPMTLTVTLRVTIDQIIYELIDGIMNVVGYEGTSSSYTVAQTVQGYTVTRIADSAFEGNANLTSIDLPDTIEIIGKRAFANCTKLAEMN